MPEEAKATKSPKPIKISKLDEGNRSVAELAKLINPAVLVGRPPQNMMRSYNVSPRNDVEQDGTAGGVTA